MLKILSTTPFRIAGLALGYYLLARLGLMLAIPPGYATAIWPAVGLAVAALLLGNYWLVLGVWLGSLAINGQLAWAEGNYLLPAAIATGAAIQAALAKYLIERRYRGPWKFTRLSQTLSVILLGGPVASLVSAAVGSVSLLVFGQITVDALLASAFTWWLGDSLGVVVFTPLLLLCSEHKASVSLKRKLVVCLPLVLIFFCLTWLYAANKHSVERELIGDLEAEAELADAFLQELIARKSTVMFATAGLMRSSGPVNHEAFQAFQSTLREGQVGLYAIGWAPRINADQLGSLSQRAAALGHHDFTAVERGSSGIVPVGSRSRYQPLLHIAPLAGNERARGFDLLSEPARRKAIERALATGKMSATGPLTLAGDVSPTPSYLLFLPVAPGINDDIIAAAIGVDHLAQPFWGLQASHNANILLRDRDSGTRLFSSTEQMGESGRFRFSRELQFFDQSWVLTLWLDDARVARHMHSQLWPLLIGGFGIIGSLALLIIYATGSQASATAQVEAATTQLRRERAFLESIIDHLPLLLYIKDANSRRYLRVNKAAYDILENSIGRFEGHRDEELFSEGLARYNRASDDRVVNEGQIREETSPFRRNGHEYWFRTRKIPIEDPATGQVRYLLGLAEHITSQLKAERELRDSRQRISRILENVGEGIYGLDVDGRLTFVNPVALELLGFKEEELLGQRDHALLHHHHRDGREFPESDCPILQTLATGKSHRVDDQVFWRKDGTAVPVEYVSTAIVEDQTVVGAVVVFNDISRRLILERQQQEHSQRIAQINQELEEFSYVASHDIQEPLRTLIYFCDFLEEDLGGELPKKAATDLAYIKDATRRMGTLINDMLEYSRAGRSDLDAIPVDMNNCLAQVKKDLTLLVRERRASLTIEPLPTVLGDVNGLARIFQNLLQNAIKFCSGRAPVITVREVENDGHSTTIAVSDNGFGIDERFIEQIFGAFRRLHHAEEYPGSGIGLAVVKKLVERHRGSIRVESTPGEGSTFFVTLPLLGSRWSSWEEKNRTKP